MHDLVLDGVGPDRLPTRSPASCSGPSSSPARDDHGVRPPFALATILDGLDEESRALGQALVSRPGPDPRDLNDRALAYEIERLVLELEDDEWQERSGYNRDLTAEAEREGDAASVDRLMLERRLLNEQRRSLDKRRDQTHSSLARRCPPDEPHPAAPGPSPRAPTPGGPADHGRSPGQAARRGRAGATASLQARPRGGEAREHAPAQGDGHGRARRRGHADADADDEDDFDLSAEDAEPDAAAVLSVEIVSEEAIEGVAVPPDMDAPAKLSPAEVDEPTTEELEAEAIAADMIGIDDPVRMYLKEIGKVALADRRGGGRPRQGDRARRADHRRAVEGGRLAPRVDPPRHRAQDADDEAAAPPAVRRRDPRDGRRRPRGPRAADLLAARRDFHLVKAGKDVQSEGTTALLKEARALLAPTRRRRPAEVFQPLLDWSYLSVHNGDLDSRDNLGPAGDLRLDPRRRRVPGAPALDRGRQRLRLHAQAGLRPRGPAADQDARPPRRGGPDRARRPRAADPDLRWSSRSRRSTSAAGCRSWT